MKNIFLTAVISMTVILCACQTAPNLSMPNNIQAISEGMAINMLDGLNQHNYTAFSRDFNEDMKKAMDESAFNQMHTDISEKIGTYQDLTYQKAEIEQGFIVAYFNISYEKAPLTLRLVLEAEQPYRIAGIWFPDFPVD